MANYGMPEDGGKQSNLYVNMDATSNSSFVYQFCKKYDVNLTEELENRIDRLLSKYSKDGKIDNDKLINEIENTIREYREETRSEVEKSNVNTPSQYNSVSGGYGSNADEGIYDIDPDDMYQIASICSSITSSLKGAKITVPPRAVKYANGVIAAARLIKNVSLSLSDFNSIINDTINAAEENDTLYSDNLSWDEIMARYNSNQNSKPIELTPEYIIEHAKELGVDIIDLADYDKFGIYYESTKVDGDGEPIIKVRTLADLSDKNGSQFAHMNVDGKDCYYDMITHNFYIDGYDPHIDEGKTVVRGVPSENKTNPLNATIYLPSNTTDPSHLNTYTYFVSPEEMYTSHITEGKNGKLDENGKPDIGQDTNSVLIQIKKNTANNGAWDKHDETGYMTKFVNNMFKTDLPNGHCQNIIGGDSKYGAISLVVAAQNDDLYNTVYCVDNAVIVSDVHVKSPRSKTQITADEVLKLKGKNLYFISVFNDENLNHGSKNGGDWVSVNTDDSHFIKGLKYLCNTLSEDDPSNESGTNIHVIYTPNVAGVEKDPEKTLEKGTDKVGASIETLCDECKDLSVNFTYHDGRIDNLWGNLFSEFWKTHTKGNYIPVELATAAMTNYNYYSINS